MSYHSGGPKDRYANTTARQNMARQMAEYREDELRARRDWSEDRKRPFEDHKDCHLCGFDVHGTSVKWWNKAKDEMVHTDCARRLA